MSESLIIACPQCNQLNRVPKLKLSADGKCGSCKSPLFLDSPLTLNQNSFSNHVVKSDLPILIDFWAPWCGPCKMMAPVLDEVVKKLEPNLRVGKINTENEQSLAAQFNIRSIPTLVVFHKGKEIERIAGAMAQDQLIQWTNQALKKIT